MTPHANSNAPESEMCPFCREISSGTLPEEYSRAAGVRSRIFYEDTDFVVFPSLSPLAAGHVMIVPRTHVTSSVQLGQLTFAKLAALKSELARSSEHWWLPALFWEHGIGLGASGGCGISHAHVHMLPVANNLLMNITRRLDEEFPNACVVSFENLGQAVDPRSSYLYWSRSRESRVETTSIVPSQFMRRLIAKELGSYRSDWKELYNWDILRSTLHAWQERPLVASAAL